MSTGTTCSHATASPGAGTVAGRPPRNDVPLAPEAGVAELLPEQQQALVQALLQALSRAGSPARHVQTHISHVLLHGGRAYKIKKALATGYLDQSTLALRRAACAEELRVNRRFAPDLYLGLVPITGSVEQPVLCGEGPALEVAVEMRAFDEEGLWDRLAARGALCDADVDELAALLAAFHDRAAVATADTHGAALVQVASLMQASLEELLAPAQGTADLSDGEHAALQRLQAWTHETAAHLDPVWKRRLAEGRVREGHGDLHLGNVARDAGHCVVFDGLEFDAGLRWLDVMNDCAFLAMDLHAHGLPALAYRFMNAYLEASGDYDGMRVFAFHCVHCALVRAKVARLRAAQSSGATRTAALEAAQRYIAFAERCAAGRQRALIITHGLSGSGKTTLTQGLLQALGAARVRADVERKRLAGLAPLQRSHSQPGGGLYGSAMNAATYRRLLDAAAAVLAGGWPVILDATFLRRADREAAQRLAAALSVPYVILHVEAATPLLQQRLLHRAQAGQDASEADLEVLQRQLRLQEPLLATERPFTCTVAAAAAPQCPAVVDWEPLLQRLRSAASGAGDAPA